ADAALVRARIVLAVIFQHDMQRAKTELAAFKQKHPAASGTLAGKTGPLADTLQAYFDAPPKLPPDATTGDAWPTFGGAPDRSSRVPGGIPRYWPSQPSRTESIRVDDSVTRHPPYTAPGRQPFGHPVIVDGEVFVADGMRVLCFDLQTGKYRRV